MIFDPSLAAAARRHVRAQAKSQKASSSAGAATNSSETGTSSNTKPQDGSLGTATTATTAAATTGSAGASEDLGGTAGKVVVGRGEHLGPAPSGIGHGFGGGGLAPAAPSLAQSSSGSPNGVDLEGATRVGPVVPRARTMKRRVLLKIVVLGCSNVSRIAYIACIELAVLPRSRSANSGKMKSNCSN